MSLPDTQQAFEFEQATVVYRKEYSVVTEMGMPRLEVMVLDAYGFQREFTLRLCRRVDSKDLYWEAHTYQHPGRRNIQEMRSISAERFVRRFLELCERYPTLLFNSTDKTSGTPRNRGFVHFSEQLLCGEPCSVRLLN